MIPSLWCNLQSIFHQEGINPPQISVVPSSRWAIRGNVCQHVESLNGELCRTLVLD